MSSYTVVVGVANPHTVSRLMHVACLLAQQFAGQIMVTSVVPPAGEARATDNQQDPMSEADQILEQALDYAQTQQITCDSTVLVARQIHEGIIDVADAQQADVILVGFSEGPAPSLQQDENFDRIIDALATHSPCHLLVAKFRNGQQFDKVLVPVAGELDFASTSELATALYHQEGASVDFVHFTPSVQEAEQKSQQLHDWLEASGAAQWSSAAMEVSDEPAQAIIDASAGYDAVIVGTPPLHTLRRQLFGSLGEQVANHAACTTFLVRSAEHL